MYTTSYCSYSTNNSNPFILSLGCCNLSSWFYYTNDRNIKFISYCIQCKCTCRVTGNDDCLDLLFLQKTNDLPGVPDNCLFRFTSIRHSRRITKIYDFL